MITHKIFHIQVGAEQCWEEVEGFVSGDKEMMSLVSVKLFNRYTGFLSNIDIVKKKGYEYILNFGNPEEERFNFVEMENEIKKMQKIFFIKRNPNRPLSSIANKLGATIYGGFKDERDFYIVLPIIDNYKVGDIFYYPRKGYKWVVMHDGYGFKTYDLHYVGVSIRNLQPHSFPADPDEIVERTNVFEEYARTGIIENDLYKHFFK